MNVQVVESVLKLNDDVANSNRQLLQQHGIFTIDLIGGPGCGKTLLIERTLAALRKSMRIAVVVGDLTTARDAERIAAFCTNVVQINTGKGCHLEAHQVRHALDKLDLTEIDLLIIENVGNLVCPVGFDLGQNAKVGMFATTEGPDKPAKYPQLVSAADLLLLNKMDLLHYVPFDLAQWHRDVARLNSHVTVVECSAYANDLAPWLSWLRKQVGTRKNGAVKRHELAS
ncbi:MAG TPA: hydrogenase nickel incorporation protein HypB [Phycisphaerae bacterium]|nr:hydrogenase nickel incorporation protein HypB [Phycisphaerae bacterium]